MWEAIGSAIPNLDATAQVAVAVMVGLVALVTVYAKLIVPMVDKDRREARGPSAGKELKDSIVALHGSTSRLETIMQAMGTDMSKQSGYFAENLKLVQAMQAEVQEMNKTLDSIDNRIATLITETARRR